MTLHTHLKAHHTVRMIDGVEVEKPKDYDYYFVLDDGFPSEIQLDCMKYNAATEVIKLPNWMEFWDSLIGCAVRNEKSYKDVSIINNEFMIIMHHAPTLSQFVPVGENGEVLDIPEQPSRDDFHEDEDDYYNRAFEEWVGQFKEYQTAQSNVIYEGWGKYHNNTIESGENMISFREDGKIYFSGEDCSRRIYTTDDLNREVQIYLKIK
jgi:hypothetical protein